MQEQEQESIIFDVKGINIIEGYSDVAQVYDNFKRLVFEDKNIVAVILRSDCLGDDDQLSRLEVTASANKFKNLFADGDWLNRFPLMKKIVNFFPLAWDRKNTDNTDNTEDHRNFSLLEDGKLAKLLSSVAKLFADKKESMPDGINSIYQSFFAFVTEALPDRNTNEQLKNNSHDGELILSYFVIIEQHLQETHDSIRIESPDCVTGFFQSTGNPAVSKPIPNPEPNSPLRYIDDQFSFK